MTYFIQSETLTKICNAIRKITGRSESMSLADGIAALDNYTPPAGDNSEFLLQLFSKKLQGKLEIPEGVTVLKNNIVSGNRELTEIKLPSTLAEIESYSLDNLNVKELTIPSSVVKLNSRCCSWAGYQKVTFLGTPTELSNEAFYGCNSLKDIYVPWADGDVAGAPFGAENATVHYNTNA